MRAKIIPFDLETAKKIQAGEIEGRIITSKLGNPVRILCDNLVNTLYPEFCMVCAILRNSSEYILTFKLNGTTTNFHEEGKLVIELPEETSKHEFKPFDKVLVRDSDGRCWVPRLFEIYSGGTEKYYCQDGVGYMQCIPYEGNEHLVTDKPKEK